MIVPNNVQTPSELERFGRVLAQRFDGYKGRHTKVSDLIERKPQVVSHDDSSSVSVSPEGE